MSIKFFTPDGDGDTRIEVPSVDEAQMREVDRIAVEEFNLAILQMMENAGRNLALQTIRFLEETDKPNQGIKIVVAAGTGGNGGGGLCAARHLHNQGYPVSVVLTKPPEQLKGPTKSQLAILDAAGIQTNEPKEADKLFEEGAVILDAIIGYSLKGGPRGTSKELIEKVNASGKPVLSLDLPSGLDATNGETPGVCVRADQTLTLALPKPGLANPASGVIYLADIGIPPEVYHPLGIRFQPFFGGKGILALKIDCEN